MNRRVSYRDHIHGRNPQNKLGASSAGDAVPAGPTVLGPAEAAFDDNETGELAGADVNEPGEAAIPHAGSATSKPGNRGGAHQGHPQNLVTPTSAGSGADGKGHQGGGAQKRGGHAQNAVLPAKTGKQPNPVGAKRDPHGRAAPPKGKTGSRRLVSSKDLGHYLTRVAGK